MDLKSRVTKIYHSFPVIRELFQVRELLKQLDHRMGAFATLNILDMMAPLQPRYSDPLRLCRFAAQVSSQNGEDGILQEIFRRVGTTSRTFVEVGVGDGAENNTAFLLACGWTGFWIDISGTFRETLKGRPDLPSGCLQSRVLSATRENITSTLKGMGVPSEFDLLSLDVDQNTYHLWDGLTDFRPRVIVVEYNAAIPAEIEWVTRYSPERSWDGTQNYGASLKSLELLGRVRGYSLVGCEFTGVNAFFVRNDVLKPELFCGPFTAENHHEPPRHILIGRRGYRTAILDRTG